LQVLYQLTHTSSTFSLTVFETGSGFMSGLVWTTVFLFMLSCAQHWLRWDLMNVLLRLPLN
jgi:hypothetical protein